MSAAFPLTRAELDSGRVERVMSIGRAEFFRMLPGAVGLPLVHRGAQVSGKTWQLTADELPSLNIGLLSLPRLRVQIEFPSRDGAAMQDFMARFDRHFQRGGG